MFNDFRELDGGERGATLVEYALIVGLIGGVAIVVLTALGQDIVGIFSRILPALTSPS